MVPTACTTWLRIYIGILIAYAYVYYLHIYTGMEDEDSDRSAQIASYSGNRASGVSIKYHHEKLPHLANAPIPPAAAATPSATAHAV